MIDPFDKGLVLHALANGLTEQRSTSIVFGPVLALLTVNGHVPEVRMVRRETKEVGDQEACHGVCDAKRRGRELHRPQTLDREVVC